MSEVVPGQVHHDEALRRQAASLEAALPRLMRRTFTLPINHPAGDLPVAQLRACSFLLQAGATPITELAEELGVSVSAATQIADRLEKTGFVERVAEPGDRRVKLLSLTQDGRDIMQQRRERRIQRMAEVLTAVPSDRRGDVLEAIECLLEASMGLPVADPGVPPLSLPGDLQFADAADTGAG
ncbi:MAG TPA: MarR family transcriptional regulator [Capsulimonadaceae bacterium]|jgi:DNA-binding MarR family transcriptional regulator